MLLKFVIMFLAVAIPFGFVIYFFPNTTYNVKNDKIED